MGSKKFRWYDRKPIDMNLEEKVDLLQLKVDKLEKTLWQIKNIVIGIAIGGLIVAIAFGIVSLREVKEVVGTLK